jgi:endoglucanase
MDKFIIIALLCSTFTYAYGQHHPATYNPHWTVSHGAIVRGDSTQKTVALVFSGDEFGDGLDAIISALSKHHVTGSFFFTGRFYRNPGFQPKIKLLYKSHNYLGPHSNAHLLYADWIRRDSTLVTQDSFRTDLKNNLAAIHALGIDTAGPHYFIPPYEWWNDTIAAWSRAIGWQLINFTPGIRTNADYTYPEMGKSYLGSDAILQSLKHYASTRPAGLDGAIILIHAGTDPRRTDKLYNRLDELINWLQSNGYRCLSIPEFLSP